jgi:quinol monooxygenase YgiN
MKRRDVITLPPKGDAKMMDIVVTQRVNPGKEKEFEALARQLEASTVANDKGCLRYEWYCSTSPQTYILIERWTDEAAVQAHMKADHFTGLLPKLRECVPEPFSAMRLTRLTQS